MLSMKPAALALIGTLLLISMPMALPAHSAPQPTPDACHGAMHQRAGNMPAPSKSPPVNHFCCAANHSVAMPETILKSALPAMASVVMVVEPMLPGSTTWTPRPLVTAMGPPSAPTPLRI